MRALRLATVAAVLLIASAQTPIANAQILDTGEGRCSRCGHSEQDTQRYVNSFLNQLFFPKSMLRSASIAASLYLFNGTYTIHGARSPDSNFDSVTIAITAELKGALPTGNYRVVVTTPGGRTSTQTYAIGDERFKVVGILVPRFESSADKSTDAGSGGPSGPPSGGGPGKSQGGSRTHARCSHSRRQDLSKETVLWCSID